MSKSTFNTHFKVKNAISRSNTPFQGQLHHFKVKCDYFCEICLILGFIPFAMKLVAMTRQPRCNSRFAYRYGNLIEWLLSTEMG